MLKNKERRRILLVSHGMASRKYGGVGLYVQMLVHEFFEMGHLAFYLLHQKVQNLQFTRPIINGAPTYR